jgi:SPP1 family predicted phage head-tail adaptor
MPLNAGELDQRITIRQRAAGLDAHGHPSGAWTNVATVWAAARPITGREFFAAGETRSEVSVKFRIRYRTGITAAMQVLWRGVAHDIVAPPMELFGGKEVLELMCSTGKQDGR